jgi:hypothetical protein
MPSVPMAYACLSGQIAGMKGRTASVLCVLVSSTLGIFPAHAQNETDGGWRFLVQPYAMFPNMNGRTAIANLPTIDVNEDPSDIFENLQMGAMLYAEARNEAWTISTDLLYMDLGTDVSGEGQILGIAGEVDVSQLGWELAAMRQVTPSFELGIGVTYNRIKADADITVETPFGSSALSAGRTQEWFDPTIVARSTRPLTDKWFFQARGNIGGFGIGTASKLMWQLMVDIGYRPSDSWFFTFGYRFIDIDYERGSGVDRFVYDMRTFGPVLRLGFNL